MKRSGATIVEVLMGVLVMGIGATAVFTLFPISVSMSIRAHQLTESKILVENIREIIKFTPDILAPPVDGLTYRGEWKSSVAYDVNDAVVPESKPGSVLRRPSLLYVATTKVAAGNSGLSEPNWPTTPLDTVLDGTVVLGTLTNGVHWTARPQVHFVVDPLGRANAAFAPFDRTFGNRLSVDPAYNSPLARSSHGALSEFVHPDAWDVIYEALPVAPFVASTITFPQDFNNNVPSGTVVRIPLLGGGSFTSTVTSSVTPHVLNVDTVFPVGQLDRTRPMRLEVFEQQVTCLLAVHSNGPTVPPSVQCATIFRRSFNSDDEYVYDANWGNAAYVAVPRVSEGTLDANQVKVAWTSSGPNKEPVPFTKDNGYLFDVRNAVFYKAIDIGPTIVSGSESSFVVTLEDTVRHPTSGLAIDVGQAILMRGIVEVYDLTF